MTSGQKKPIRLPLKPSQCIVFDLVAKRVYVAEIRAFARMP